MRPWKLAETNYAYVKDNPFEVAVLPMAATEPTTTPASPSQTSASPIGSVSPMSRLSYTISDWFR